MESPIVNLSKVSADDTELYGNDLKSTGGESADVNYPLLTVDDFASELIKHKEFYNLKLLNESKVLHYYIISNKYFLLFSSIPLN